MAKERLSLPRMRRLIQGHSAGITQGIPSVFARQEERQKPLQRQVIWTAAKNAGQSRLPAIAPDRETQPQHP